MDEIKKTELPENGGEKQDEEKEQKTAGAGRVTLSRPVTYNGKQYTELAFDFEKLTGADGQNIEDEIRASGRTVLIPSLDADYLLGMAARACAEQIGTDFFAAAALRDTLKVRTLARNFLNASE